MLEAVRSQDNGVRLGNDTFNIVAYADDVTLVNSTVTGLQASIDTCVEYSKLWRFCFNPLKSKCITIGPQLLCNPPCFYLGKELMTMCEEIDILGVTFNCQNTCTNHVNHRIKKCRQNYYGLENIGLSYPGLNTGVKTHLWKTMCNPVLMYGLDTIAVSNKHMADLESTQGTMVKRFLGIGKRSHHTSLLKALGIPRISDCLTWKTLSLFNRSFKVESPLLSLHARMLAEYIVNGRTSKGSTIDRIISYGYSPIDTAFSDSCSVSSAVACAPFSGPSDGIVDSLKYLVYHENFLKPWADEHVLAVLLTRCF